MRRLMRMAALTMALLFLLPATAEAAVGSITVRIAWGGVPVAGGSVTLYQVAALTDGTGFAVTEGFSGCDVELDGPLTPAAARTLADYARALGLPGDTRSLGAEGCARFRGLEEGLYLLVQPAAGAGFGPIEPFLVSIPTVLEGTAYYEVDASPKAAPTPADPPGLPQTGQLRWPVPVLAALGAALVLLGLAPEGRKRREK